MTFGYAADGSGDLANKIQAGDQTIESDNYFERIEIVGDHTQCIAYRRNGYRYTFEMIRVGFGPTVWKEG